MGEMNDGVAVSNGQDKVETATCSNRGLQVSVSFGRFENDSLSWEKFSAFSPNKYLEEVEKCATPGSVAQKKAYFEAHYKKIAEKKAQLMDPTEKNASFGSSVEKEGDGGAETYSWLAESGIIGGSDSHCCTPEEDKHVTDIADDEVKEDNIQNLKEKTDAFVLVEEGGGEEDKRVTEVKEEIPSKDSEVVKPGLVVLVEEEEEEKQVEVEVKEETLSKECQAVKVEENPDEAIVLEDDAKEVKEEVKKQIPIPSKDCAELKEIKRRTKNEKARMNCARGSLKTNEVTNRKSPRSMEMATKKLASSVSKARGLSTPRVSKPISTSSTSMSITRSFIKKETASTLPRNKQMSLNLGPSASDPTALATSRKSLIMEQMGDKDIVKRAFKTFQKRLDQSSPCTDGQRRAPKQVPVRTAIVSPLTTTPRVNNRPARPGSVEKNSVGTHRAPSFGLRNNAGVEKQRELSKNKSGARGVERMQAKPKAGMEDVKTRRHSLDLKAKPIQNPLPVPSLSKG